MRRSCFAMGVLILTLAGCGGPRDPQPPTVTELNAKLTSGDAQAQIDAAAWAEHLGVKAAETAPALRAALKSPDARVRRSAAAGLAQIGPAAAEAVPELTTALTDPDAKVQKAAADALGQLGPAASAAIPALEQLSEQKTDSCNSAQTALKKIRP